ncbi:MAG TPA: asparaginase [Myxococcota bacterium]|nr:asparaginase [Myxococcota bacterium]
MTSAPTPDPATETPPAADGWAGLAENPVLARVWRGDYVESQHRGTWALVDVAGRVLEGAGDWQHPYFARSSLKSLQALPLLESGAAERFGFADEELALAVASHDGEACHTDRVAALLRRLGLGEEHLRCGPQAPGNADTRREMLRAGREPGALHNNCSGKHAGFLALALHLGVEPARYLDPESESQRLVRRAVREMAGLEEAELTAAVDGCSAPTFRMPLASLATAIARVANPDGLAPDRAAACRRITAAVAAFPELVAGTQGRLCTDLSRATAGRLFGKIGGEAVYVVGVRGADRGLAVKIDDGSLRGMHAVVLRLLERFDLLGAEEAAALESWRERGLRNWAGLDIGRVEVLA